MPNEETLKTSNTSEASIDWGTTAGMVLGGAAVILGVGFVYYKFYDKIAKPIYQRYIKLPSKSKKTKKGKK